jgi:hypothetical protein
VHGTEETPAIFGDLVCAAAKSGRPIVVGLEQFSFEQPAIEAFLASDGGAEAVRDLLQSPFWTRLRTYPDGRTSRAMLALMQRLRNMRAGRKIQDVVAFVDDSNSPAVAGTIDPQTHERGMAGSLAAATKRYQNALILVLVGNAHGQKVARSSNGQSYQPMTALLPAGQSISLLAIDKGGTGWNCTSEGCGPHPMSGMGNDKRDVVLGPAPIPGYDGVISTGAESHASPPAVGDARPNPLPGVAP